MEALWTAFIKRVFGCVKWRVIEINDQEARNAGRNKCCMIVSNGGIFWLDGFGKGAWCYRVADIPESLHAFRSGINGKRFSVDI